jgi:hypothetical protein
MRHHRLPFLSERVMIEHGEPIRQIFMVFTFACEWSALLGPRPRPRLGRVRRGGPTGGIE